MKIKKIEINNFRGIKYFSGSFEQFDFKNKLTVLDGENGFGKTTLFDAVEFCITGNIRRLNNGGITKDKGSVPKTILKNKDFFGEESFVKIVFDNEKEIIRKINKDQEGNLKEEYILEGDIDYIKGINKETFKDFFYVPQENSTELLKSSSDGIKKLLDKIFNTTDEVQFRDENLKGGKGLIKKIETLEKSFIEKISEGQNNIEKENLKLEKLKKEDIEDVDFLDINNIKSFDWYKEEKGKYTKENINNIYLKNWEILLKLNENKDKLKQAYINEFIEKYKNDLSNETNKVVLSDNYNYYLYYKKNIDENYISNLENKYTKFNKFKTNFKLLEKNNINLNEIDVLFEGLDKDDDFFDELIEIEKSFKEIKKILENQNKEEKKYLDIFSNLIDFWENKYQKIENKKLEITEDFKTIESNICPLCKTEEKEEDIIKQIKFLKEKSGLLLEREKETNTFSKIFDESLLLKLEKNVEILEKEKEKIKLIKNNIILFEKFKDMIVRYKEEKEFDDFERINFLEKNIYKEKNLFYLNIIIQELESIYKNIDNFSSVDYFENRNYYFNLFNSNYLSNEKILPLLNKEILLNNINFFKNESKRVSNIEKISLEKNITEEGKKIANFTNRKNFLKKVIEILNKYAGEDLFNNMSGSGLRYGLKYEINNYKKEKVKNIALPLNIFSQRVVKNYNGMGIILTDKYIKGELDDKNPLYTFSSGQSEGLALSLMLANNLNYKSDFKTILIDDPIQSLDDLNILSFINLLRYQFADKQIIISTHDNSFSRFIRYKFWRLHGNDSQKNINMKDRFFEK